MARKLLVPVAAVLLALPLLGVLGVTSASACTADPYSGVCVTAANYHVILTDGTLAVQSTPNVDNVKSSVKQGATIRVICQINYGGTDPYDGLTSRTWDYITAGGWVYDHYVSTPAQDSNGRSPGVRHCDEGKGTPLTPAISVPDIAPRGIVVLGHTAGPLFHDGPGFWNAAVAQSPASAESVGYCQNLVLANTDFPWLLPDWPLNYVAQWPSVAAQHGRAVLSHPVVGAVVVFKPGWHDGWNYDQGHVAMVMRTYPDGTYTIAEFKWDAEGGGLGILDLRRISATDDAASAFIR